MLISNINAWREILARIFEGLAVEQNISPDWLINPQTKRQLKLDLHFPRIGVAIRFIGLRGSEQRRGLNPTERAQQRARDAARREVSEAHGISVAEVSVTTPEPSQVFEALEMALSRATRRLKGDQALSETERSARVANLMRVRGAVHTLSRQVQVEADLGLYAELWLDRQYRESVAGTDEVQTPPADLPSLTVDMLVEHSYFGLGIIQAIEPGATPTDALVTIRFENDEERTFLAGLLADKLTI